MSDFVLQDAPKPPPAAVVALTSTSAPRFLVMRTHFNGALIPGAHRYAMTLEDAERIAAEILRAAHDGDRVCIWALHSEAQQVAAPVRFARGGAQ